MESHRGEICGLLWAQDKLTGYENVILLIDLRRHPISGSNRNAKIII